MRFLTRLAWLAVVGLMAAYLGIGCSDDNPSDGGTADTTPPVVSNVTAIDVQHVQVTFDEEVSASSAENTSNYSIVEVVLVNAAAAPGDDSRSAESPAIVGIASATLLANKTTVLLSLYDSMSGMQYNLTVSGIRDARGNAMESDQSTEFTGTDAPDETAPTIVSRSPAPGATGVGTSQSVIVTFSELMQQSTVVEAFSWTHEGGTVQAVVQQTENTEYTFSPVEALSVNTLYTVTLATTALDLAGNPLAETSWTFRTTGTVDTTPPHLVSTVPANGATNVSTTVTLTLTFSEAIDPSSMENILVTPQPGEGVEEWSNGGKTVSFTPYEPLLDDTQYTLVLPEGSYRDLSGNANIAMSTIQFTTGSSFETGRINGTVSGDPLSAHASDPTGAIVVATTQLLFSEGEGGPDVIGVGEVLANNTYSIIHLPDSTYYPFAIMDSNGDGQLDPECGDAIGAYGVDVSAMDFTQESVLIEGGSTVNGVDFPLFDPLAICGTIFYDGEAYVQGLETYPYYVGAFDSETFDPQNPGNPAFGTDGSSLVWNPNYSINTLDGGLEPGTYYVGCFLDVNMSGSYEPDVDPAGFYGTIEDPAPVTVGDGTDALDIDIHLADPVGVPTLAARAWKAPSGERGLRANLQGACERIRKMLDSRD